MNNPNGFLLIDKPAGWTSFDVVAKVRSLLKQAGIAKPKVGHTGTLDPLATGLLVLVVGSYTKRAGEFSKLDKTYEVTMKLGQTSTTGDEEGKKVTINSRQPTIEEIQQAINDFIGEIEQIPPQYSAIKVNGERAYKLARKGQKVELEPRKVNVYSLQLTDYSYPVVQFTAEVSSGTYIRSLVQDIGEKLATGAYMSALRRNKVGQFKLKDALSLEELTGKEIVKVLKN